MKSGTAMNGRVGIIVGLALVPITYLVADAASGPLLVTQPGSGTPEAVPLVSALVFTVIGGAVGIGLARAVVRVCRPQITLSAYSPGPFPTAALHPGPEREAQSTTRRSTPTNGWTTSDE